MFRYTCSSCSEIHEGAPSFSYLAPAPYDQQTEQIRNRGSLGSDLCTFTDEDGEHYFIRVCLEIPIHNYSEPFLWGVWSSVSQSNYERYVDTYDDPDPEDCYFGWLCNYLPFYPDTYAIKLDVRRRSGPIDRCLLSLSLQSLPSTARSTRR